MTDLKEEPGEDWRVGKRVQRKHATTGLAVPNGAQGEIIDAIHETLVIALDTGGVVQEHESRWQIAA
jgi:hypothetical protein